MPTVSDKILRIKRSDTVADKIKRLIVDRDLRPDDRLPPEKDLIRQFQSSRGTIRESLKSLEVQGLIEIIPGRKGGARICPVSISQATQLLANYFHFQNLSVTQIYDLRKVIEPMLAESVVGLLQSEDFHSLEESITISSSYLKGESERLACRQAELEFHNIIARACPNPYLSFQGRFMNYILLNFVEFKRFEPHIKQDFAASNLKYHTGLIQAYHDEDRSQVRELMVDHMVDAFKYISETEAFFKQGLIP